MKMKELMDFYRDKRVLVTGHTGFKGAWLCRILTLAGAQVTGYSLEPPTDPSLFEIAGLEDVMAVSYTHLDVYKRQGLRLTPDRRMIPNRPLRSSGKTTA